MVLLGTHRMILEVTPFPVEISQEHIYTPLGWLLGTVGISL